MEFPLLFALVMVIVAAAMIWGARRRHRHAPPAAPEPNRVDQPHAGIGPQDAALADRAGARMSERARGGVDRPDVPDRGENGD